MQFKRLPSGRREAKGQAAIGRVQSQKAELAYLEAKWNSGFNAISRLAWRAAIFAGISILDEVLLPDRL